MSKLSYERFLCEIRTLNILSQQYSLNPWDVKTVEGISFLMTKIWKQDAAVVDTGAIGFENETVEVEDNARSTVKQCGLASSEFHIVYCEAYQVPVLYFQLRGNEGQLLPLEKIMSPQGEQLLASHQLHPLLDLPFFYLHPCQTAQFMSNLDTDGPGRCCFIFEFHFIHGVGVSYVLSWLSIVGPIVGIELPRGFFREFKFVDPDDMKAV
jgi:hypothetical protein